VTITSAGITDPGYCLAEVLQAVHFTAVKALLSWCCWLKSPDVVGCSCIGHPGNSSPRDPCHVLFLPSSSLKVLDRDSLPIVTKGGRATGRALKRF